MKTVRLLLAVLIIVFLTCCSYSKRTNKLFDKLEKDICEFENKMESSPSFTKRIEVFFGDDKVFPAQTIKYAKDPMYIEVFRDINNYRYVFKDEEGRAFRYHQHSPNRVRRSYLGLIDDFSIEEIYEINNLAVDSIFKREKDRSKCGIRKSSDMYIVSSRFVDLLYDDDEPIFKRIFGKIGRQMEECFSNEVTLSYIFDAQTAAFTFSAKLASKKERDYTSLIISLKYIIEDFPRIDYLSLDYNFDTATCFEEIARETDITQQYVKKPGANCLYAYFEKGIYVLKYDEQYLDSLKINLFDSKFNEIVFDFHKIKEYKNILIIPECGYYYLGLESNQYVSINFEKISYKTIADLIAPKNVAATNAGEIEGEYDIEIYEIIADKPKAISLRNTGIRTIYLIYPRLGKYEFHALNRNAKVYIKVEKGANKFYIVNEHPRDSSTSAPISYEYSFMVEEFEENGLSENFDEMEQITEKFSEKYYSAGLGLPSKYLKMIVEEEGTYRIDCAYKDQAMRLEFYVYDKDNNFVSFLSLQNTVYLKQGVYVIKIANKKADFGVGRVKYAFIGSDND